MKGRRSRIALHVLLALAALGSQLEAQDRCAELTDVSGEESAAQWIEGTLQRVENSAVDNAAAADDVSIIAEKGTSKAKLTLTQPGVGGGQLIGTAATPVSKTEDSTPLFSLDGPPDDLELGLAWRSRRWHGALPPASDLVKLSQYQHELCTACGVPAASPCTDAEFATAVAGRPETFKSRALDAFDAGPFEESLFGNLHLREFSFGSNAGRTQRKYFDLEGSTKDEDRKTYAVHFGYGRIFAKSRWLAKIETRRKFKEADKSALCKPVEGAEVEEPSTLENCKSLPLGEAAQVDSVPLSFEYRHWFADKAIGAKILYDLEREVFAAQIPVYLYPDKDGRLSGGIRLDWEEHEDPVLSVFVASALGAD